MSDEEKKRILPYDPFLADEEEGRGSLGGGTGTGGSTGEVQFRYKDPLSGPTRDDLLPSAEIKRLAQIHKETHKGRVEKQKLALEDRAAKKEGRYVPPTVEQQIKNVLGGGGGRSSQYKSHPISQKAQFSGIDKQVIGIAAINQANTNEEARDALQNQLENQLQHRATPKFNPRPRPG